MGCAIVYVQDKAVAPEPDGANLDGDEDNVNVDDFLNTGAYKEDLYMPPVDEEPFRDQRGQPSRPTTCTQRLVFDGLSQDTPPEAGDHQAQVAPGNIFSPNTLHQTVQAGFTAPQPSPEKNKTKKHRKRSKGAKASASQPAAKIMRGLEDTIPRRGDGLPRVHEAGEPILSEDLLHLAEGPMLSLQQSICTLEGLLLKDKNPSYPVFSVKVPKELVDFVQEDPADVFFIAYEDIFNLFHSRRLDYNLVRLYALSVAMKIRRDNIPYVVMVDPYYMRDSQLVEGSRTRAMATEYLQRLMITNKKKNNLLVPFFFE